MAGTFAGFLLLDFGAVQFLRLLSTVTGAWPLLIIPVVAAFAGLVIGWIVWSNRRWG